jgi:molybdopterin-biosynthesis enzyme MoeA-like protein
MGCACCCHARRHKVKLVCQCSFTCLCAGADLKLHDPTVALMQQHYAARGVELNEARLRMATLPTPSEVLFTPGMWVPLVNINSVYILPGIPRLFQGMISANKVW